MRGAKTISPEWRLFAMCTQKNVNECWKEKKFNENLSIV
jgi:hypothetical protein